MLKLSEIIPDPNQPRKFFDQVALDELTTTAKSLGIFQAILVRPCSPKVQNHRKATYMIVVGERRYKASVAAGLKEIPATIRELTDEQALEIQIVENLMRKDVQPMEEAVAFKSLFHHNHFAVEEIALRVGKSPSYVAGRIKLCDLLPDFQEMLFLHKMQLTDAYKLSRFEASAQKQLLDERAKNWKKQGANWSLGNISWYITNAQNNLNKATFKLNDTLLYKEAGSCTVCPHNSACNPVLFEEFNKEKICHSPVCFGIKTDRAYQKKLEELQQKPDVLFIADTSYIGDQDKHKIKVAEEMGITVLNQKAFSKVEEFEHPGTWEEYWEEHKEWVLDDDMSEAETQTAMNEEKQEWQGEVDQYHQNVKDQEAARANGLIVKAFVVCGNGQGKMTDIILSSKAGATGAVTNDMQALQLELQTLRDKEKRNEELDREKVYNQCMELLQEPFITRASEFVTQDEWVAVAVFMAEHSYAARSYAKEALGYTGDEYGHMDLFTYLRKFDWQRSLQIIGRMIRIALFGSMVNKTYADFKKSGKAAAMWAIAQSSIAAEVDNACTAQAEKTSKRNGNIQRQIDAIHTKMEALTAAPEPVEETIVDAPEYLPPGKSKAKKKDLQTEPV
ncbi:MAG: ParB/RepB/Spo0J family partition protein [Bacteroidota bacterium]